MVDNYCNVIKTEIVESRHLESAPKVNHFSSSMWEMSANNAAKIHKLVFEMFRFQNLITHRQTDEAEYIIIRTAGH